MAKWILMIQTNCNDPSREDEFNKWYNETHIPDFLSVPGFVRPVRYEQVFVPGTAYQKDDPKVAKVKHLALYQIETDDIDKTIKALRDKMAEVRAAGRFTDLLALVTRGIYKQMGE